MAEEDCVPLPEFFPFVEEVRSRWETEEQVGAISGNSFLPANLQPTHSYFFSRYPHIWGWATWARCWRKHNSGDTVWPVKGGLGSLWPDMDKREKDYWERIFNRVYRHELETWDYRWLLSFWRNHWLAVTPRENLVQNTGFGEGATNTRDRSVDPGVERTGRMSFPLSHPDEIRRDEAADQAVFRNHYLNRVALRPRPFAGSGQGVQLEEPGSGLTSDGCRKWRDRFRVGGAEVRDRGSPAQKFFSGLRNLLCECVEAFLVSIQGCVGVGGTYTKRFGGRHGG